MKRIAWPRFTIAGLGALILVPALVAASPAAEYSGSIFPLAGALTIHPTASSSFRCEQRFSDNTEDVSFEASLDAAGGDTRLSIEYSPDDQSLRLEYYPLRPGSRDDRVVLSSGFESMSLTDMRRSGEITPDQLEGLDLLSRAFTEGILVGLTLLPSQQIPSESIVSALELGLAQSGTDFQVSAGSSKSTRVVRGVTLSQGRAHLVLELEATLSGFSLSRYAQIEVVGFELIDISSGFPTRSGMTMHVVVDGSETLALEGSTTCRIEGDYAVPTHVSEQLPGASQVGRATTAELESERQRRREAERRVASLERDISPDAESGPPSYGEDRPTSFGTGFFVDRKGTLLTNSHVIRGCNRVTVRELVGSRKEAAVVRESRASDLALLQTGKQQTEPLALRSAGEPVEQGEQIVVFGFPLYGALSSGGNLTEGIITATSGFRDDFRFFQISAPVQQGNSGGPLLDLSGQLVGVVVGKANALRIAEATGDIPQNINFAISLPIVRAFLNAAQIDYTLGEQSPTRNIINVGRKARESTTLVECWR